MDQLTLLGGLAIAGLILFSILAAFKNIVQFFSLPKLHQYLRENPN